VRSLVLVMLAIPLAACTSQDDMTLLHREITDVQRQVQQLQTSTLDKSDLAAMEQHLQDLTAKTMTSNADLAQKVKGLQEQIEALHSSLELTSKRLQTIAQELTAARTQAAAGSQPPVAAAPGTPTAPTAVTAAPTAPAGGTSPPATPAAPPDLAVASPEELYRSAYEDYLRGNYDLAAQGFREYLKRWGQTELADNALYWIGECYDAQGKSQEALDTFSQVLQQYPTSDKAAASQLKKGLIYLKQGDQGQGVLNLQYVVYEHPGSKEADLAREKLRSLGLTIR
jgi:tol-pal system protein YbgF